MAFYAVQLHSSCRRCCRQEKNWKETEIENKKLKIFKKYKKKKENKGQRKKNKRLKKKNQDFQSCRLQVDLHYDSQVT